MLEAVIYDGIEYRAINRLYAVSRCGKFLRRLVPINPKPRADGYLAIGRQQLAHRLVAQAWIRNPEGLHVHHINGNRSDNRAENLEVISPAEHFGDRHKATNGKHSMSAAGKEALRQIRTGAKTSEATKQKQREAAIRLGCKPPPRIFGTKCSEAAKEKMRLNSPNACGCVVLGVLYASFSEAGQAIGMKPHTVRKRCLSENFPDFTLQR